MLLIKSSFIKSKEITFQKWRLYFGTLQELIKKSFYQTKIPS